VFSFGFVILTGCNGVGWIRLAAEFAAYLRGSAKCLDIVNAVERDAEN